MDVVRFLVGDVQSVQPLTPGCLQACQHEASLGDLLDVSWHVL